jgi:HEAT repeat protein
MTVLTLSLCIVPLGLTVQAEAASREIAAQIKRLDRGLPAAVRRAAVKRLRQLEEAPAAPRALPALTRCARDPDAEVRYEALHALAGICVIHERPCPLALIEGLFDRNHDVRAAAWTCVGAFHKYPEKALPLLLRAAEHEDANVRQSVLIPLATLGGKSAVVLAALKKRTADPDLQVRNNAHVAVYQINKDLSFIVPYWLECIASYQPIKLGKDDQTEELKRKGAARNLIIIGAAEQLCQLGRERPAELANILRKRLSDKSPGMRRVSARILGDMAGDNEKARAIVRKLHVEGELRRLLRDPDASVRAEAGHALETIEGR